MVGVVGFLFSRWTRAELPEVEARIATRPAFTVAESITDSVAKLFDGRERSQLDAGLRAIGDAHGGARLAVLADDGALIASASSDLRPREGVPGGGLADFMITQDRAGQRTLTNVRISGRALRAKDGRLLGHVYVLPPGDTLVAEGTRLVASAQRAIVTAVLLAIVVAALATSLLATPLVGQVARLAAAARAISGGALGTRVDERSPGEVGELERSFNEMAATLHEAEERKRRLVSDIAHELRTPLTNVIGQLEAMRDGMHAADDATLSSTLDEALLLKRLIEELQELSLAEARALALDPERLDLADEARRAVEVTRAIAPGVRFECAGGQPLMIVADRRRLGQILRNLLQNAVTHSPVGAEIVVRSVREGTHAALEVTDHGIGIPADEMSRIWERFHRVDPSRSRHTGGMGLGLAVARELTHAMGGTIDAVSEVGKGSTFKLRFVLA